jgi:hypothetical protein
VKMLENRLEKAMQRYNAAVARNNDLRQKIDDLRRERLTFDSIYQQLMRDLAEKKRDVAQIMEVRGERRREESLRVIPVSCSHCRGLPQLPESSS